MAQRSVHVLPCNHGGACVQRERYPAPTSAALGGTATPLQAVSGATLPAAPWAGHGATSVQCMGAYWPLQSQRAGRAGRAGCAVHRHPMCLPRAVLSCMTASEGPTCQCHRQAGKQHRHTMCSLHSLRGPRINHRQAGKQHWRFCLQLRSKARALRDSSGGFGTGACGRCLLQRGRSRSGSGGGRCFGAHRPDAAESHAYILCSYSLVGLCEGRADETGRGRAQGTLARRCLATRAQRRTSR